MSVLALVLYWLPVIGLGLMVANWEWDKWGRRAQRAVPGSLPHFEFLRRRRIWRWPGFMFWPAMVPGWTQLFAEAVAEASWWAGMWGAFLLLALFAGRSDWRKFRRELEEDEDDWWNRGKRLGKRLWKAARSARIAPVRLPAPTPTGI